MQCVSTLGMCTLLPCSPDPCAPPPPPLSPLPGDVGTCELPLLVRRLTDKVTWLQFWGMHDFHPSWNHIFHNRIPCFVAGRVRISTPADEYDLAADPIMLIVVMLSTSYRFPPPSYLRTLWSPSWPCRATIGSSSRRHSGPEAASGSATRPSSLRGASAAQGGTLTCRLTASTTSSSGTAGESVKRWVQCCVFS